MRLPQLYLCLGKIEMSPAPLTAVQILRKTYVSKTVQIMLIGLLGRLSTRLCTLASLLWLLAVKSPWQTVDHL
jgi:hypothetical protein